MTPASHQSLGILRAHLKRLRLKQTAQREVVLTALLDGPRYVTIDDLAVRVQAVDKRIGFSTVYRSVKLFIGAGLAKEHHFLHGKTCYEHSFDAKPHDYLICTRCGKVAEFSNPLIPAVQEKVSREMDFKLTGHRLELYGICSVCQGPRSLRPDED